MVKSDNVLPDPNSKVLCSIILSKFWMLTKINNMMNNESVFWNPNSVGLFNQPYLGCLQNWKIWWKTKCPPGFKFWGMWPNLTEFCFFAKSFPDTCKKVCDCIQAKVLVISSDICQILNKLSHYIIHFRFFNNKETEWEIEKNIHW